MTPILSALPDAAFRSLALAAAVAIGLRLFRIRSVLALKCAWTFVLAAAFLMPLLLPISSRLPRIAVVLPIAAPAPSNNPAPASLASVATAVPSQITSSAAQAPTPADSAPPTTAPPTTGSDRFSLLPVTAAPATAAIPARPALSMLQIAALLYFAVAALLLFRLFYGLFSAFKIWREAEPVSAPLLASADGLRIRASAAVSSPVTIGSGILLPADYITWDAEKARIVLAHERSHVRQRDFYLQSLAAFYAAILWISPLGWWLKRKLSDLAEALSDRSGLEQAASRSAYAQILLEFAAAPRPTLIGVAMARSSNLSQRIDRLVNDRSFRQAFAASRRALITAVLVPALMFAAATLLRVEAATQAQQPSAPATTASPITGQSHPDQAPEAGPNSVQAPPQSEPAPAAAPTPAAVPPLHIDVPAIHVNVPARHIDIPAIHIDQPARNIDVPAVHFDVPAQHINVPAVHVNVPAQHIDIPAQHIDQPAQHIDIPAIHIDMPSSDNGGGHAALGSTGQLLAMLNGMGHSLFGRQDAPANEATFDRTLTFTGKLDLHIANASGAIHLTRGTANQVTIHARVYSRESSDAEQVSSIAANPPIQQEGSTIRIGLQHQHGRNHISIDYEIQAPADAALTAESGSGNIVDDGVGAAAKLETGSGSIVATGLQGGFKAETGSGNITIENAGQGDAKAEAGSGNIDVKGVNGALTAEVGSGNIKAQGTPTSPWKLESGSGSVELTVGTAPLTLDAETGSGSISSDQPMAMPSSSDRHHIHATLNGGGPEVKVETGSGSIRIH